MNDTWAVRQEIARRLEIVYPTWRVWITDTWWWATRKTAALPPGADRAELYATLCHDTADELRDALDEQDRRLERFNTRRTSTTARRYPLRSLLAALLLTPALLAGTSGGCDCGSGPGLPETQAVGCGSPGRSAQEPNPRDLTTSEEKLADKFGYSQRQIRQAIHAVKNKAGLRGKDVKIDVKTGEVYPQTPRGGIGDSVGNILDYLP